METEESKRLKRNILYSWLEKNRDRIAEKILHNCKSSYYYYKSANIKIK